MITPKIKEHIGYYLSMIIMVSLGIFLALQASYNLRLQVTIIVVTAFWYVLWGIAHHVIEHDLSSKIVVEYVLIGSLGMSIMFFLVMATN